MDINKSHEISFIYGYEAGICMKNVITFIAVFLLTIPFVAANVVTTPLWVDMGLGAVIFGIPIGIIEGFLVWLFVRSRSTWRGLWIPVLVLANSVSWAASLLFSYLVKYQYGFRIFNEGIYNLKLFFAFVAVVFVFTTAIEWGVLHLFRKKHGVKSISMLYALIGANLVSYAALVIWFVIYAIRLRAALSL